jgi:membrane complex biogenesis BtpA family protein
MSEALSVLKGLSKNDKPVFGMVHFLPLPGTPCYDSAAGTKAILDTALKDAEALAAAGVDGFMFSNEGDRPYLSDVSKHTVAIMSRLVYEVSSRYKLPFGVSVLADPMAAISVGAAVQANFVRIFLSWVYASDWGIVDPDAGALQRYRASLADAPLVFANVSGHTEPLGNRSIKDITRGAIKFGLADAICLAGTTAGSEIAVGDIKEAREGSDGCVPVIVGTGVGVGNIEKMFPLGDAFIVGTSLKEKGETFNPIDPARAKKFMEKVRDLRGRYL